MMDRQRLLAQALMAPAAAPVQRREFAVDPAQRVAPGQASVGNATSHFAELDTVDPIARLLLRGGQGQTVNETRRTWNQATDAAMNFGMFAGPGARTADLDALKRAQTMAEAGTDMRSIWRDTGWFLSPDQRWRFEISDRGASMTGHQSGRLSDVLRHDDLFAAYPEMRDIPTNVSQSQRPSGAYTRVLLGQDVINAAGPDDASRLSVLLHEGQHAEQAITGGRNMHEGAGAGYLQNAAELEARATARRQNYGDVARYMGAFPLNDYRR